MNEKEDLKTTSISFRVTKGYKEALKKVAKKNRISLSMLCEQIIFKKFSTEILAEEEST